jgi:cell division protein FtsI (penicillin-binding protein 3)
MSIGYETMLPPIATLAFYNGIANRGKFIKPRFVTAELKDGQVVREFPTEVIKESMCKPSTLADIQEILEKVVSEGLGKKAGNNGKYFKVSGKTGTAQIASAGGGGYHSGPTRYMVSFCGYFPSEAPKYSCIVCIVKTGLPASGGGQCGPVFSEISQYIMSKGKSHDSKEISDSNSVYVPSAVRGQEKKSNLIMEELGIRTKIEAKADSIPENRVPDVIGMGARDAVYELQKRGLNVRLVGRGRVKSQNIPAGSVAERGKTITIQMEQISK